MLLDSGRPKPKRPSRSRARPVLALLSRRRSLYTTRRLIEAARRRGFAVRLVDLLACDLFVQTGALRLLYKGQPFPAPACAMPRIGAKLTPHGLALLRHLEALAVPLLNGSRAIEQSRDKLRALQLLAAHGVPVPRTALTRRQADLTDLLEQLGGLPVILKLPQGTQGVGVLLARTRAEVESIVATVRNLGQQLLLQEFVSEANGCDLRALVVGDRVVGAMRRVARGGEFRANLHLGAEARPLELDPAVARVAVRAAQVLGLEVAGVDLLESSRGPLVVEVNSSPGLEGLEQATGKDLAGEIVARAALLVPSMAAPTAAAAPPA